MILPTILSIEKRPRQSPRPGRRTSRLQQHRFEEGVVREAQLRPHTHMQMGEEVPPHAGEGAWDSTQLFGQVGAHQHIRERHTADPAWVVVHTPAVLRLRVTRHGVRAEHVLSFDHDSSGTPKPLVGSYGMQL